MTLILAELTPGYVALASDRRLTWRVGDRVTLQEDSDVKAFNLGGYFLMGFTGVGRVPDGTLGGRRFEGWVAEQLAGRPVHQYFHALAASLTDVFRRQGLQRNAHAFLAVGFAGDRRTGALRPLEVLVSNAVNDRGRWAPEKVGDVFQAVPRPLGNEKRRLSTVGWPVRDETWQRANTSLRYAMRADPEDPRGVVEPMVRALWDTADASQQHVGETALLATLPACAVPACYSAAGADPPWRSDPVACVIRRSEQPQGEAALYAPAIICPEGALMGIEVDTKPLPPPQKGF